MRQPVFVPARDVSAFVVSELTPDVCENRIRILSLTADAGMSIVIVDAAAFWTNPILLCTWKLSLRTQLLPLIVGLIFTVPG